MEIHYLSNITRLFKTNAFIRNNRLKLVKNQAKAKQHPEAELLLFESYSLFSTVLSSKTNMRYSKKVCKTSASVLIRLYIKSGLNMSTGHWTMLGKKSSYVLLQKGHYQA